MSSETPGHRESGKNLKFEVGQIIKIGEIEYRIIGTDNSTPHPSGQYKKWDYFLQAVKNLRDEMRITEDKLLRLMEKPQEEKPNDPAID